MRILIAIACLDDRCGVLFNRRRQSADRVLRERIAQMVGTSTLRMNTYSAEQFAKVDIPNLLIDDAYLFHAKAGEYCFVEGDSLQPFEDHIEACILFGWNRIYPADTYFDLDLNNEIWALTDSETFAGSSHDMITMEVYRKRENI